MVPSTDAVLPTPPRPAVTHDLIAGMSVAGLLVPEAVAYAGIAGLPPQAGLVGLLAGLATYAALGRSPVAIVSATSSSAAVLGAASSSLVATGASADRLALAAGLVLLTGLLLALAALARLGTVCSFISRPVLHGFGFGLAITITVRQFTKMVGLSHCAPEPLRCALDTALSWATWSPTGLTLGLAALVLLLALSRWHRLPAPLVVLGLAAMAAALWPAAFQGLARVGDIHLAWPSPGVPTIDIEDWKRLSELALPLTLLLFAESWGSVRGQPGSQSVSANRELMALGMANLMSGVLQGAPVGAGFSATAASAAAGARTRLAGLVAAVASLVLVALTLTWLAQVPEAALCAIVIAAMRHSLDPARLRVYFRWRRDRIVLLTAALAVLMLGIVYGLLVGVAVSLMVMLRELATPRLSELGRVGTSHDFLAIDAHTEAAPVPDVLVLRPEAPLFFGNIERTMAEVEQRASRSAQRAVVLSLEETPDLDATALQGLVEACLQLHARGRRVVLARLKDPVLDLLNRSMLPGVDQLILEPGSVDDAVARAGAALR